MCRIEFHAPASKMDVYPRPYPASKAVPDWVKQMPLERGGGPTIKRCPPFLEAMTAGYIIPAPADVRFDYSPDLKLSWSCPQDPTLVSGHRTSQYEGSPFGNQLVVKFINPWIIRTPAGYSTLVTTPLNRFDVPFIPLSGIVETESYYREIHLPMICVMQPGTSYVVGRGAPLVQCIPIKRESWKSDFIPLDETRRREADQPFLQQRETAYKDQFWRKLEYD